MQRSIETFSRGSRHSPSLCPLSLTHTQIEYKMPVMTIIFVTDKCKHCVTCYISVYHEKHFFLHILFLSGCTSVHEYKMFACVEELFSGNTHTHCESLLSHGMKFKNCMSAYSPLIWEAENFCKMSPLVS